MIMTTTNGKKTSSMSPYETIRLSAKAAGEGETVRGKCPWCHGGRTHEDSFAITNIGGQAKYICHRNSCCGPSRGAINLSGVITPINKPPPKKPKEFTLKTYPLSDANLGYLEKKFEFTKEICEAYGLLKSEENDIVIPMFNWMGQRQGTIRRRPKGMVPKAIQYNGNNCDGLSWYNYPPEYEVSGVPLKFDYERVILVEDCYSAMKANYFMNSVSLNGTYLSIDQAIEISKHPYREVIVALDADASAQAMKLARRYLTLLPGLRVLRLTKDIKDTTYLELSKLLN